MNQQKQNKLCKLYLNGFHKYFIIVKHFRELIDNSQTNFLMKPIGYLKSVFKDKNGTPRQSNTCSEFQGEVTIGKNLFTNPEHSLDGLSQFSHVWYI